MSMADWLRASVVEGSDELTNMDRLSGGLQAFGAALQGQDPSAYTKDFLRRKDEAKRKMAISGLMSEMGIGGTQASLLSEMPLAAQQQFLLNKMQQDEAEKRRRAAAGAAAAQKARESAARAQQFQMLMGGGTPAPSDGSDGQVGPTVAAAQPSDPYSMYQNALRKAYMAPPGTVDPSTIKALEERAKFFAPKEREVIEGADGFKYYQDTGERVLPNVEVDQGFDADRYRVVGNTLYDLGAEGGPSPVGQGQGTQETVFGPNGEPILVRGPAGSNAKFTEAQAKDNVYATRAEGALQLLDQVGAEVLTSRSDRVLDFVPLGIGREAQGEDYQVAQQSGNEFLQAILRKDTGAAITEQEQVLYGQTYLPQPGDGPQVIEAKRQSRVRAIEAIRSGMNPMQQNVADRAVVMAAKRAEESKPSQGRRGAASKEPVIKFESPEQIMQFDIMNATAEELDAWNAAMDELEANQ